MSKRLIYFSPVSWFDFAQRPHRFVSWFHASTGGDVLWIEPYPTRFPYWFDLKSMILRKESVTGDTPAWLTVVAPHVLPIEPVLGSQVVNRFFWNKLLEQLVDFANQDDSAIFIGKPSKLAIDALRRCNTRLAVYDAMDDFPAFYSGISKAVMIDTERVIARSVDCVWASSSCLYDKFKSLVGSVFLVPNACAQDEFQEVDKPLEASSIPVVGYIGTVGKWFDWDLVIDIAVQNPGVVVRVIGPVYVKPDSPLPSNIEILPRCHNKDAINAMRNFSVGIIPFKVNALTDAVDPIKYYEYRALGLPVISTAFGEMALRSRESGVFMVDCNSALALVVGEALRFKAEPCDVHEFRSLNSWGYRFCSTCSL